MKIGFDNLPEAVRASLDEDLAAMQRAAAAKGVAVPDVEVSVVALERAGVPAALPTHAVPTPMPQPPASFARRCDWETERQSFQIVSDDGGLWVIGGGSEGGLHGFGEVLACLTGVIWGGVLEEDVLFGAVRELPTAVQQPRFAYRARDGSPPNDDLRGFITWLSRNRYNTKCFTSSGRARRSAEEIRELTAIMDARCFHQVVGYHAMEYWLPEEELDRRPEWQGMRDGQRRRRAQVVLPDCPHLNAELPIQPCYSNEELAEYLTGRMARHCHDHPEIEIFSLWPHDGVNNWCECPDCLRQTPYEHMYSLTMRLLPKLPEKMPVELIVYSNLLNLPRHPLPPSDRVISMLCPYLRPYAHRIFDDGGPEELVTGNLWPAPDRINPVDDREYGMLFERWREVWRQSGSAPGIFEYGAAFPDETRRVDFTRYLYFPAADLRRDEAAWYAVNGVRYFYMCGVYKGWPDNYLQLNFARSMWGGEDDADEFERAYYTGLAGVWGMELRDCLKAVAAKLYAEEEYAAELAALDHLLAALPDAPFVRRYRLWSEYVRLARPAREHELAGDFANAAEQERRVQAFLEQHAEELSDHVLLRCPRRLSETFMQRFEERLAGEAGADYKL